MKNKLYNVIFPLWLIALVPPVILLTIPANFLIDSIVLLIGLKKFDKLNKKSFWSKIWKVVLIGFGVDFIGSALLFGIAWLDINATFNDIINAIMLNPFDNIWGFLIVLIVVILCGYLIYFFNKKWVTNKKIAILLGIVTAPYLFLFPTILLYRDSFGPSVNLNELKGSSVDKVINHINTSFTDYKYLDGVLEINVSSNQSSVDSNANIYMEQDACMLFYWIDDINLVSFSDGNRIYEYSSKYIDGIIKNIDNINDILLLYTKYYNLNDRYIGSIGGEYFVFDTSDVCYNDEVAEYVKDGESYYFNCSILDTGYVLKDNVKTNLKDALDQGLFDIDLFMELNI